ncbi:hypothetical protein L3X38_037177 [Prunus dulcis]|uniref:Retrotransposon Copia-like N-terminal domain-containing protein n=1 Tax=Prunus dulcis TaxID=3755 RepID=A0AAD4YQE4_PRUDU|nr:hypothetical protein L3X38_037177 [Prunus dulcis]
MSDVTESSSSTPIMTVHTESSTNLLMGFKLNGSNYEIWASMIKLHATTQGKLGYQTGDTDARDSKDLKFGKWKIADAAVKSWMLRTMEPSLLLIRCFMMALTYPNFMNRGARLPVSSKRAAVMADHVYDFLAGLYNTYDKVRSDILQRSSAFAVLPRCLTSVEKDKLKCDHCGEKETYYRHMLGIAWGTRLGEGAEAFKKGTTGW